MFDVLVVNGGVTCCVVELTIEEAFSYAISVVLTTEGVVLFCVTAVLSAEVFIFIVVLTEPALLSI